MSKKTLVASLLGVLLVAGIVQHYSVAAARAIDWLAVEVKEAAAEEDLATDDDQTKTTDTNATTKKKRGNRFVRAIGVPFRALGRLFGGGGKKNDEQARRISNKEVEQFESNPLLRIRDANSVTAPTGAASDSNSSALAFDNHLKQGRKLLMAGDVNGAISELTAATAINSKSAEANRLLGVAYESNGLRDLALRSLEMAVHSEENNAEHLNNLGFLLYKNGDLERATKYLKRAAKIAQNSARIWNNLGLVYCERGKFDDAYKSFAQAAGEYGGRLSIAAQLQQRGYAKDAIKHLEKAQAIQPNSAEVLTKLVSLYEMTGRPTDAESARRAIVALKTFADAK